MSTCGTCQKWREHLGQSGQGIGFGRCKMINRARMLSEISKCRFNPSQHVERTQQQLEKEKADE